MPEKWNGVERRSGLDRRKGERRRSDAFSIERILNGTASRRTGRDRRQAIRRDPQDADTEPESMIGAQLAEMTKAASGR